MAKEFAQAFYVSPRWINTRRAYAKSVGHLCEECMAKGVYTPGRIVHHIIPITPETIDDPRITLDWSNLKLVCMDCHRQIHEAEFQKKKKGVRYTVNGDGSVVVDTPPSEA